MDEVYHETFNKETVEKLWVTKLYQKYISCKIVSNEQKKKGNQY